MRRHGCAEEKTPEGNTLDVVVGRNKPTKLEAEETVEGVRNAEGGKAAGKGNPTHGRCQWMPR